MRADPAKQRTRTWHIRRDVAGCPDGQRRWDRAYQLLLHWAVAPPHTKEAAGHAGYGTASGGGLGGLRVVEADSAGGTVRTGLDRAPTAGAHDWAADDA